MTVGLPSRVGGREPSEGIVALHPERPKKRQSSRLEGNTLILRPPGESDCQKSVGFTNRREGDVRVRVRDGVERGASPLPSPPPEGPEGEGGEGSR